jgi:hypothetical protein
MKSYGHINLQQNELQQAVLQLEQNFPAEPVPGRLVFKDKKLYVCIEIADNTPVWVPLTNELTSYTHIQSTSSNVWTVVHNLNDSAPVFQVYGADNKLVYLDDFEILSNNSIKVYFGTSITGKAVVVSGSITGSVRLTEFIHTQTELSSTWNISHGLGYYPLVRVFVGSQEVIPLSITHISNFLTVIEFSSAQVGIARLV